jgi:hypothetical protein
MTTGSRGSPSTPAFTPGLSGTWRWRDWSGDDGKFNGSQLRWNDYVCEQDDYTIADCRVQFRCNLPGGGTDTRVASGTHYRRYMSLPLLSGDINKALSKIAEKSKNHSFNLAVNTAQLGKTSQMVVGTLGKLGRSMLALKRGDFSTAARQLGAKPRTSRLTTKDVSGRWLELQYGWLPLLGDCYEAAKAYENITKGPRSYRSTSSAYREGTFNYSASPGTESCTQQFFRSHRYIYEGTEQMSSARQLGLTDPLSVLWEVIPYSFVVDWFIPIGDYLSNINQIPYLTGRWLVCNVIGTKGSPVWNWIGGPATYPFCGYHGSSHRYQSLTIKPSFKRRAGYYSRTPLGSPPSVPLPTFNTSGAIHGRRVWNAISLAHQRFR